MAAAAQHKIVIVEDEGLIAADLENRLKSAGYQVPGTADSAQPALKLIRETSPDLVLMDIRLKGDQDGIYVADVVREQLDIPVVYLTAYEDRATLERASRTQAYGYIKKPIVSASLKGSIEMAIAKGRKTRPKLKIGICGEHGGDAASVKFCHQVGMDYVSASPFRVPIARLAAAQAVIEERAAKTHGKKKKRLARLVMNSCEPSFPHRSNCSRRRCAAPDDGKANCSIPSATIPRSPLQAAGRSYATMGANLLESSRQTVTSLGARKPTWLASRRRTSLLANRRRRHWGKANNAFVTCSITCQSRFCSSMLGTRPRCSADCAQKVSRI